MLYEIINMSDPYTIEAHSLEIAAVACLVLGRGQYGLKALNGEKDDDVPIFMFGGSDPWFIEKFGRGADLTVKDVMNNKRIELADCLDSCLIGRQDDRKEFEAAMALIRDTAERAKFKAERHDKRLTSMNDIGGRAYEAAAILRKPKPDVELPRAPQQVFSI